MARVVVATDDFNRVDSGDLGANWDTPNTPQLRACSILGNMCAPGAVGDNAHERWNANTFDPAQYSLATFGALVAAANNWGAVSVRWQSLASQNFYKVVGRTSAQNASNIYRVDAGVLISIGSSTTAFASPDTLELEAEGSAFTAYRNGVSIISATDATYATGVTGIGCSVDTNREHAKMNSWEAGNLTPDAGGSGRLTAAPRLRAAAGGRRQRGRGRGR